MWLTTGEACVRPISWRSKVQQVAHSPQRIPEAQIPNKSQLWRNRRIEHWGNVSACQIDHILFWVTPDSGTMCITGFIRLLVALKPNKHEQWTEHRAPQSLSICPRVMGSIQGLWLKSKSYHIYLDRLCSCFDFIELHIQVMQIIYVIASRLQSRSV